MSNPRYSSADLYPPLPHHTNPAGYAYDPDAYESLNASTDYLGGGGAAGAAGTATPRSYQGTTYSGPNDSTQFLNQSGSLGGGGGFGSSMAGGRAYGEKYSDDTGSGYYGEDGPPESMLRSAGGGGGGGKRGGLGKGATRKRWFIVAAVLLVLVIIGAIIGGVVGAKRASNGTSSDRNSSSNLKDSADPAPSKGSGSNSADAIKDSAVTGGNNTLITMENGQQFTYINNYGGFWVSTPFDDSARPNSWTKPLNEPWDYTNDKIHGVNIGGWLVTEPFIVPGLFEPYENDTEPAIDEYTLMGKYGKDAVARMTEHYDTFITEEDFALIAGSGVSWIRLVIPFWAIETIEGEPFVEGVAWQYVLKALTWARKYGLRVNLDLHTVPGSQNGWNHSGKLGNIGFLNGTMAIVNAQRTLNYIRTLTEFISQDQYKNVVPMFSIINEPAVDTIGNQTMREFYLDAYNMIRSITGIGKGPFVTFHDGFQGFPTWAGFLPGCDRCAMDQHNYLGFTTPSNDSTGYNAAKPCAYWAMNYNVSMQAYGLSLSGEWSQAINDCGVYLNNVGNGARYDGTYIAPGQTTPTFQAVGSCASWNDWQSWDDTLKSQLQSVAYAHMDATQNWFFWTWKIGNSTKTGVPPNPMWHMRLGLEQGWFPKDIRPYVGMCRTLMAQQGFEALPTTAVFTAFPSPWMTGGAGAGTIAADQQASYGTWPPQSINIIGAAATNLLTYTPTGTPITLSGTTPTAYPAAATKTVAPGNGWANAADTAPANAPVAGCTYAGPYDFPPVPTAPCVGA